jgi:hypothetical protein
MSSSQVLLFSDISSLMEFSQQLLIQDRFAHKRWFIVFSEEMKDELFFQIFSKKGHAGFSQIDSLNVFINHSLKRLGGISDCLLFDKKRLFISLKVLFSKEPTIRELFIEDTIDEKKEEELLKTLSSEMSVFLDIQKGDVKEEKALFLKHTLRAAFPQYYFLEDALKLLFEDLRGAVFIGFPTVSKCYLEILKELDITILSQVPSSMYLGDVLNPKEHMLFLKKLNKKQDVSFYQDKAHPLLGYFSKCYAQYYTDLNSLEIPFDFVERTDFARFDLGALQKSLDEGFLENPILKNEAIRVESFTHPYFECLAVFENLKIFKGQIKSDEIAILSSDPESYSSFLQMLGKTVNEAVKFAYINQNERLFEFIQFYLSERHQQNSLNFLNLVILRSIDLFEDEAQKEKIKKFFDFFQNVQKKAFCHQGFIEGSCFEKLAITNKLLSKSFLFDLDPFELDDENLWLIDSIDQNEIEELLETIEVFSSLFAFVKNFAETNLQKNLEHLIELLKLPFFLAIDTSITLLKLNNYKKEFSSYDVSLDILSTLKLFKDCFCFKQEGEFDAIKIFNLSTPPVKSYKAIFYLGMNAKSSNNQTLVIHDTRAILEKSMYPLWFNAAKDLYSISDVRGYPDLSINESILWMDQLKNCFKEIEETKLTTKQVNLENAKEFLNEALIEELVEKLKQENHTFKLEIKQVENFLKDEEAFIKQSLLSIKKEDHFLDQNVHLFNLHAWKLQQIKNANTKDVDLSYFESLKKFEEEQVHEGFIRTPFLEEGKNYLQFRSSLKLELANSIKLELSGVSNESKEKKILKDPEKILRLLAILNFFKSV